MVPCQVPAFLRPGRLYDVVRLSPNVLPTCGSVRNGIVNGPAGAVEEHELENCKENHGACEKHVGPLRPVAERADKDHEDNDAKGKDNAMRRLRDRSG